MLSLILPSQFFLTLKYINQGYNQYHITARERLRKSNMYYRRKTCLEFTNNLHIPERTSIATSIRILDIATESLRQGNQKREKANYVRNKSPEFAKRSFSQKPEPPKSQRINKA